MASCVRNIRTKNYQNLTIGFQVIVQNVGDVFFVTQCSFYAQQQNVSRVLAITQASVCLSVRSSVCHTLELYENGTSKDDQIFTVGCPM